jgi:hypothetical protein
VSEFSEAYRRSIEDGDNAVEDEILHMKIRFLEKTVGRGLSAAAEQRVDEVHNKARDGLKQLGREYNSRTRKAITSENPYGASRAPSAAAPSPVQRISPPPAARANPVQPRSPHYPPGPSCSPGTHTRVGPDGYVYEKPLGSSDYQPKTIGGIPERDAPIGGFPALPPTIGPRIQAREGLFGSPSTGPQDQSLHYRHTPGPFSGP